jgi:hypothetical protein
MSAIRWSHRALRHAAAVALGLTLAVTPAGAQAPGSTGVDPTWLVSWTGISGNSSGGFITAAVVASPPGPWEPNTVFYQWIGANSSATLSPAGGNGAPNYTYTFRNVFDLAVADVPGFFLAFRCARDNSLISYSLNGAPMGTDCGENFRFGGNQLLVTGFVPGSNTLDFTVTGDGTTDGLLVDMQRVGDITVTPEPASAGLLAIGLVGIAGIVRRRRSSIGA